MKILVKVKTGARAERVDELANNDFVVQVRARAERGKANDAIMVLLSKYFAVPKNQVRILSGQTARKKLIEITP